MTYAFTFDASACSGCKACQVACKDKNNLPVGVLWRRVYEIAGGTWTNVGTGSSSPGVWENTVFAYNLTIACNHCAHPKCAGVCPTDAYVVRDDGIVYIDTTKCMGCGYCSWACPYAAPQYNPVLGHMTKCNFCFDNIDAGLPPSCVAACPMRVLDFSEIREQGVESSKLVLWQKPAREHSYPLPEYSNTEPHLVIRQHTGMLNDFDKAVSNQEEVKPKKAKSELSLVFFTLLTQMAVGIAVFSLLSGPLSIPLLVTLGVLLGVGGLISILHLGKPLNAWRSLNHLKKSWLSREILMFGLFGISWLVCLLMPGMGKLPLAIIGVGLVYSMAQVYRLRSIPAWDVNRTLPVFTASTVVLGGLALEFFNSSNFRLLIVGIGLGAALWLSLSEREKAHRMARRIRLGLIVLALVGMTIRYLMPDIVGEWLAVPIFIGILIEEVIGRSLFYQRLHQRLL